MLRDLQLSFEIVVRLF